jgi:hypothetical protein
MPAAYLTLGDRQLNVHADRAHAALSELGESSRLETMLRSAYRSLSFDFEVPRASSLYLPVGHPSGFQMWNSVRASPVGAIDCVDSLWVQSSIPAAARTLSEEAALTEFAAWIALEKPRGAIRN